MSLAPGSCSCAFPSVTGRGAQDGGPSENGRVLLLAHLCAGRESFGLWVTGWKPVVRQVTVSGSLKNDTWLVSVESASGQGQDGSRRVRGLDVLGDVRPSRPRALMGRWTAAAVMCLVFAPWSEAAAVSADGPKEIVFAVRQPGAGSHWYENFGYYAFDQSDKVYGREGRLCRLNLETGELTVLLEDPAGTVRDPQVHYGGRKILFSYRPGGTDWFHLYEINVDGSNLRQLTSGPYDDIEPTYLPDGDILFCSSRCKRWVNCWYTPVAVLYRCDARGDDVRPLSANIEHDNTP